MGSRNGPLRVEAVCKRFVPSTQLRTIATVENCRTELQPPSPQPSPAQAGEGVFSRSTGTGGEGRWEPEGRDHPKRWGEGEPPCAFAVLDSRECRRSPTWRSRTRRVRSRPSLISLRPLSDASEALRPSSRCLLQSVAAILARCHVRRETAPSCNDRRHDETANENRAAGLRRIRESKVLKLPRTVSVPEYRTFRRQQPFAYLRTRFQAGAHRHPEAWR